MRPEPPQSRFREYHDSHLVGKIFTGYYLSGASGVLISTEQNAGVVLPRGKIN